MKEAGDQKRMDEMREQYARECDEQEKEELEKNRHLIDNFKKYCAKKGIFLNENCFSFIPTIGIIASQPGILEGLNPSIKKDKEHLLGFNLLLRNFDKKKFVNGFLYEENYMIMAHHYFRRGFSQSASFTPHFIDKFWSMEDKEIVPYISIDFDRVRINVDTTIMYFERDTWYGASFDKDISSISDGNTKLRPPLDIKDSYISFFFNDAYSLDSKWKTKDGIKSFQAEEFKTENIQLIEDGECFYPVRYIHAEFDIEKGYFRHFDGAVHLYRKDEYFQRRDSDFGYNNKNQNHIKCDSLKLFKMNGQVSVHTWIEYSSHFFSGNPLIIEYFEGEYPQHLQESLEKIRSNM